MGWSPFDSREEEDAFFLNNRWVGELGIYVSHKEAKSRKFWSKLSHTLPKVCAYSAEREAEVIAYCEHRAVTAPDE